MSAMTQPVGFEPPPAQDEEHAAREWLDALASGSCNQDLFVHAMRARFRADRDDGWEVLSLLDQYYRRGKIKPEVFRAVKSELELSAIPDPNGQRGRPRMSTAAIPGQFPQPNVTAPATLRIAVPEDGTKPLPRLTPREFVQGDLLRGRYRIQGQLGQGGMGTVFEAIDEYRLDLPLIGPRLAIKVLHSAVTQRAVLLTALRREFQHQQALTHPNIVRVHEFDRDGDVAFFTMELLRGMLLSRLIVERGPALLKRSHALAIIRDVGAAVVHAHSRGVVHGDINPQNIFITNDGEVRVVDFGASHKVVLGGAAEHDIAESALVATPGYASCELLEGQRPDARDDLFAFACVIYLLLAGKHPFAPHTAIEARTRHLKPRRPQGLTNRQWQTLREGLHWKRERRPSDVQEWLTRMNLGPGVAHLPQLAALAEFSPPPRRHFALAAAAIVLLAALAAGGYWLKDFQFQAHRPDLAAEPAEGTAVGQSAVDEPPAQNQRTAPLPPASTRSAAAAPQSMTNSAVPVTAPPAAAPPVARAPIAASPARATPPAVSPVTAATAGGPIIAGASAPRMGSVAPNVIPARIEMTTDSVDLPLGAASADVTIRRRVSLRGPANFKWWTESGTAKPGTDFVAVAAHVDEIPEGKNTFTLSIKVTSVPRAVPKSFYVVIDQSDEGGALMGGRTLTMVTLPPSE